MIKTFQCSDKCELDDIINFYLETDHFEILHGSYEIIESNDGRLYSTTLSSKPNIHVEKSTEGKILRSWSTLTEKNMEGTREGYAFYYSPMMDNKVRLEFEGYTIIGGGPYVEWFDDGEIKRYIEYEDGDPIMCLQWHHSSVSVKPIKKSRSIDVNGVWYGEKQQIELIGYYNEDNEDYIKVKDGEWTVFGGDGDIRFKGNYDSGMYQDGNFDYDPLPNYESFENGECITSSVEAVNYYIIHRTAEDVFKERKLND